MSANSVSIFARSLAALTFSLVDSRILFISLFTASRSLFSASSASFLSCLATASFDRIVFVKNPCKAFSLAISAS